MVQMYELSGAGWYGQIYLTRGGKWTWAAAVDLVERLVCQRCEGFFTPQAAERSLRAFVKIQQENDIDRWVRFASRIHSDQLDK